jgi:hypothetical protein
MKKERSGCTTGELYCSREVTVGKRFGAGLNEEETLRLLKQWCVIGDHYDAFGCRSSAWSDGPEDSL